MSTATFERTQPQWLTAILWLVANTISFGLVGALFHNFPLAFSFPPDISSLRQFELMPAVFGGVAFGAIPSMLIGLLQWLILRRHLPLSRWWILTASAGIGLCHFISDGFPNARDLTIAILVGSVVKGVLQWLLLRQQVKPAAWWIVVTMVSSYIGWAIGITLLDSIGLLNVPWERGLDFQQHGLQGIVLGALYGLLTGVVMVWWLQGKRLGETKPA